MKTISAVDSLSFTSPLSHYVLYTAGLNQGRFIFRMRFHFFLSLSIIPSLYLSRLAPMIHDYLTPSSCGNKTCSSLSLSLPLFLSVSASLNASRVFIFITF